MWHICLDDGLFTWTKHEFNPYELKQDSHFGYWFNYQSCFICAYDRFIDEESRDQTKDPFDEQKPEKEKSTSDILKSLTGFVKKIQKTEFKKKASTNPDYIKPDIDVKLKAFTARIDSSESNKLNITRKSGSPYGRTFAPSLSLLSKIKKNEITFDVYRSLYINEMKESYVTNHTAWLGLLLDERVVLVCYCTDSEKCHRTILAKEILPNYGAEYCGEVVSNSSALAEFQDDKKSGNSKKAKKANNGQGSLF